MQRLKTEQNTVRLTVMELESVHSDSSSLENLTTSEVSRLDLETAVIMRKLKKQVTELVGALEKLSRNSESRHQQSSEFINDLKRANSALK